MSATMYFYADAGTTVRFMQYGTEHVPALGLHGPGNSLTISAFDHTPLADHLAFARSLAAACDAYVKALEVYAAAQTERHRGLDEES